MDGGDVDGGLALGEVGEDLAGSKQGGEQQKGGCGAHKRQPENGWQKCAYCSKRAA